MRIAALLGRTLPEVLAMPALEVRFWAQYLRLHPPDGVERLLAELCRLIAHAHGGDEAKHLTPYDFAPWLESPEDRRERERERLLSLSSMARADYERSRG